MPNIKEKVLKILEEANVNIDENNSPDIKIHNEKFYSRVMSEGPLGLGESYMEGWWESEHLEDFLYKLLKAKLDRKISFIKLAPFYLKAKIMNLQKGARVYEVGKSHYDIGNELYKYMLDKRMVYTCGYWRNADNLDQAQEAKLDLVCRKMGLKKGMSVLDLGCGWGSFAKFAAEKYGVSVVGVTISKEQVKLAQELCQGLDIEIRLQDYREVNEKFDRVISIGIFEHIGYKNHKTYMQVVNKTLKDDGLSLIHTIGVNYPEHHIDPWTEKYIFANSGIPTAKEIVNSIEDTFVIEDWQNFGLDYEKTLRKWRQNFIDNWETIKQLDDKYNQKFFRMWTYYLSGSMAAFRVRNNHLWQIVLTKIDNEIEYKSIR